MLGCIVLSQCRYGLAFFPAGKPLPALQIAPSHILASFVKDNC